MLGLAFFKSIFKSVKRGTSPYDIVMIVPDMEDCMHDDLTSSVLRNGEVRLLGFLKG